MTYAVRQERVAARTLRLILLTLLTSVTAQAQIPPQRFETFKGNLALGPVHVHPFLAVGELFDSNVFLQPTDTQSDFVTVISPGAILNLPVTQHQFTLAYRADILQFARLTQENTVNQTGQFRGEGHYGSGWSWYLDDQALRTTERPNTEFDALIPRTQNNGALGVEYRFADRWAAGANYLNVYYDYDNLPPTSDGTPQDYGTELNRIEQYASPVLFYLLQPKTTLLAEFTYGDISYINDVTASIRNNVNYFGRVGVRGRITSKITTTAKLGYQAKNFSNPNQKDFDGFVATGQIDYQPSDWTLITFLFDRSTQEASYIVQGDDFYINDSFTLALDHVFKSNEKLRGFVSATYANATYVVSSRNDNFYAVTTAATYQIQDWLGVSLQYLFAVRDSSGTPFDFDYTDNRVFLRVLMGL
jgi:putative beta-barrel porin BBP2